MNQIRRFIKEEDGLSTVEIILILVVLVGLVLIFKDEMVTIVETIFKTITQKIKKVGWNPCMGRPERSVLCTKKQKRRNQKESDWKVRLQ